MITVRASTVDSFRLYMDPDVDFITAEEMEARLRRGADDDSAPSEAAALGSAFHAAIAGTYNGPIIFDVASIAEASSGTEGALPEVPGSIVLDVDETPVRVTGHADWLLGLDMLELKTSTKPIAADKHAESMQWRCYCLMFGVERVTYRQVQLEEAKDGSFYAKAIDDVVMFPYPNMRDDVVGCLRSLLAFARLRGCLDAMDPDPAAANKKPPPDYSVMDF